MVKNSTIKKVILDFTKYQKFIKFSEIPNEKKNYLEVSGFFGKVVLSPLEGIIIKAIDSKIILFFDSDKVEHKALKYIYNNIIYVSYGVLYYHIVDIFIKGIGYKFELNKENLLIFCGNSLPISVNIPKNIEFLDNANSNDFSVGSSDNMFLNNFLFKIAKTATPNKYKEIGIFLNKLL